MEDVVLF